MLLYNDELEKYVKENTSVFVIPPNTYLTVYNKKIESAIKYEEGYPISIIPFSFTSTNLLLVICHLDPEGSLKGSSFLHLTPTTKNKMRIIFEKLPESYSFEVFLFGDKENLREGEEKLRKDFKSKGIRISIKKKEEILGLSYIIFYYKGDELFYKVFNSSDKLPNNLFLLLSQAKNPEIISKALLKNEVIPAFVEKEIKRTTLNSG